MKANLISLHGGHSGQFCNHAKDRLEDIILRYIDLGFTQVGITEHMPPKEDRFLYPDETAAGLCSEKLIRRFENYFKELKRLKQTYADRITIWAGMETETVSGYRQHARDLIKQHKPDYIVGSVHHVNDICFDFSKQAYLTAAESCGGSVTAMYEQYFDRQYEMIQALKPFVVGHFDLIRIFDDTYDTRLKEPGVMEKIIRNLELIKSYGLVLDFNLRPLAKGKKEPYIAPSILETARRMDICVVPGDDSHGVDEAGRFVDTGIRILETYGFSTRWPVPRLIT